MSRNRKAAIRAKRRDAHRAVWYGGGSAWKAWCCFWTWPFGHEYVEAEGERFRCVGCDKMADTYGGLA